MLRDLSTFLHAHMWRYYSANPTRRTRSLDLGSTRSGSYDGSTFKNCNCRSCSEYTPFRARQSPRPYRIVSSIYKGQNCVSFGILPPKRVSSAIKNNRRDPHEIFPGSGIGFSLRSSRLCVKLFPAKAQPTQSEILAQVNCVAFTIHSTTCDTILTGGRLSNGGVL